MFLWKRATSVLCRRSVADIGWILSEWRLEYKLIPENNNFLLENSLRLSWRAFRTSHHSAKLHLPSNLYSEAFGLKCYLFIRRGFGLTLWYLFSKDILNDLWQGPFISTNLYFWWGVKQIEVLFYLLSGY